MDSTHNFMTMEFNPANEDIVIFSTTKSLNERFTPKHQRCVFVINNGYTAPFKDNKVKEKIIIQNRTHLNTNSRFSLYQLYNKANREEKSKSNGDKTEEKESNQVAKRRRVVLMPTKEQKESSALDFKNDSSNRLVVFEANKGLSSMNANTSRNLPQEPERDDLATPTTSRQNTMQHLKNSGDDLGKFRVHRSAYNYTNYYDESEAVYSPFWWKNDQHCLQSLYTWKAPLTKEDLDRELDNYMAEVHFKPQPVEEEEDVDSFVREFMVESERFMNS